MSSELLVEGPGWSGNSKNGIIYSRSNSRVQDSNFLDSYPNAPPYRKVTDYDSTVMQEPIETNDLSDAQKIDQFVKAIQDGDVIPDYTVGAGIASRGRMPPKGLIDSVRKSQSKSEIKLRESELKSRDGSNPKSRPRPPLPSRTPPAATRSAAGIESRGKKKSSLKSIATRFS